MWACVVFRREWIQPHRELPLIPHHAFKMVFEHLTHGDLARRGKVDQLTIVIQQDASTLGTEILAEQQALYAQRPLRIGERLTHGVHRDPMLDAHRTKHMSLDEIPERENRRLTTGRVNQRPKATDAVRCRIATSYRPRTQSRRSDLQVARRFGKWVGRLASNVFSS